MRGNQSSKFSTDDKNGIKIFNLPISDKKIPGLHKNLSVFSDQIMSSVRDKLLTEVTPPVATSRNKITIVGVGQVGMACAFSILTNVSAIINIILSKSQIKSLKQKYNFNKNFLCIFSSLKFNFIVLRTCQAMLY